MTGALLLALIVAAEPVSSIQWLMGSPLRLVVPSGTEPGLVAACFDEARAYEDLLSTWRDGTPLQRLNESGAGRHRIPPALHGYLARVRDDHARTDGAFDPSVGTLRVEDGTAPIGMDRLALERSGDTTFALLPHDAYRVDPGGDGKGLAVDAMIARLREAGVSRALIDFGGSSWFGLGSPAGAGAWRVELAAPGGTRLATVSLRDRSLSVSSTVQVDHTEDGGTVRRFHLVDPRTRHPVTVERTVAVVATSATDAEVVSTAIAVDGWERARTWIDRFEGVEVAVFEDGRVVVTSPSFAPAPGLREQE